MLSDPGSGNALGATMVEALTAALLEPPTPSTRAVVLSGTGRHFCTGAHLGELAAGAAATFEQRLAEANHLGRLYAAVLRSPLLTVAAVHGSAFGGGAGLAAACDLVIADPAARIQFSEVRLGFIPALISVFLPRRVATSALARLFLDPSPLSAADAVTAGLVDEIAADPLVRACERAEAAARTSAATAVAATKRLLLDLTLPDLEDRLALAARRNAAQRGEDECQRGVAHFLSTRAFRDWLEP